MREMSSKTATVHRLLALAWQLIDNDANGP